jgi:hydroxyethylthiazole kinase
MGVLTSNRLLHVADMAGDILDRVRRRRPRVHCITNSVAQNFTANALLAVEAVPSMSTAPEEIADFVERSEAIVLNLGTLDMERRQAAEIATQVATKKQLPWVLDPVFVDRSPSRNEFATRMMARAPAAVRLNGFEFKSLARDNAEEGALQRYALQQRCIVALTGMTDTVCDGVRVVRIGNGDPLMDRVTAMGCAATALVAACLAVETDAWLATTAGLLAFGLAGERAAARARGPGSFSVEILDSLASLDRTIVLECAKVD